jgi:Right handed beta helix region
MTSPNHAAVDILDETGSDGGGSTGGAAATPTGLAVPNRPTRLNGTVNQDRRLVLTWDPQSDADSWQVHELLKDPANTLKATVTTPTSTRGPLAGGKYTYGVVAVNGQGQSPMSPTIDVHVNHSGGGTVTVDSSGGSSSWTADLYVATTGSDANAGTSSSAPKRTIAAAVAAARPGQTISVADGMYADNVIPTKGGSSAGFITVRAANRLGAKIHGNGDEHDQTAVVVKHPYLRFQDLVITGDHGTRNGVLISADNVEIIGCRIHTLCQFLTEGTGWQGGAGIDFEGPHRSNILIDGNEIFNIGLASSTQQLVHGIYCGVHGSNFRIQNNLIYRCEDFGVHPYDETEASGIQVLNNTVAGTGRGILQAPDGVTVNNLVYNVKGLHYDIRGSGNTMRNNAYAGTGDGSSTSSGATGIGNPKFVEYALDGTGDFHLRTGSPALNIGTATGAASLDRDGVSRPQGSVYDVGCYESAIG